MLNLELQKLSLQKSDVIELIPLGDFLPTAFTLNSPPPNVKILPCYLGEIIFPTHFTSKPEPYKELFKKDFSFYSASVILNGYCTFNLNINQQTFLEQIPQTPKNISVFCADNRYIGLLFQLDKQLLVIKSLQNGNTVFYKVADNFYIENNVLICKSKTPSVLKHTIFYRHSQQENSREIIKELEPSSISNPKLFTFAFLECVSLKDDVSAFLNQGMPADKVCSFIGDFDYIFTSPSAKYDFALVGDKVKFIKFKLENLKICDIESS